MIFIFFFSSPSLFFLEFMNIDDLPLNLINESATRRGSLGVNRAENRKLLRWYRFVDSMGVDFVHFRECIYPFFSFLSSTIMFKLSKLGGIETFLPQNWSFLVLMLNSFQRISEIFSLLVKNMIYRTSVPRRCLSIRFVPRTREGKMAESCPLRIEILASR